MLTTVSASADAPVSRSGARSARGYRGASVGCPSLSAVLAGALFACTLAALAAGCTAPARPGGATQAAPAAGAVADADVGSVKPGINKPFLDPAANVDDFVKAFEGESREIARASAGIVAALGLRAGASVADIGAGTGLFMAPLAAGIGPHGTLYEVDLAPAFLAHLKQRAESLALSQVAVRACTERSCELPTASIDLAFVCDTYHHFEHPQETLASLRSALRPGGRLIVVDFERIEGSSRDWVLKHMRLDKQGTRTEIEAAGFRFLDEVPVAGLSENYLLRFERP